MTSVLRIPNASVWCQLAEPGGLQLSGGSDEVIKAGRAACIPLLRKTE